MPSRQQLATVLRAAVGAAHRTFVLLAVLACLWTLRSISQRLGCEVDAGPDRGSRVEAHQLLWTPR